MFQSFMEDIYSLHIHVKSKTFFPVLTTLIYFLHIFSRGGIPPEKEHSLLNVEGI